MTHSPPIGGALAILRALALAGTALVALAYSASAQTVADPSATTWQDVPTGAGERGTQPDSGLETRRDGLPALRGLDRPGIPTTAFDQATSGGDPTAGEAPVGLSGGGEGLSRLPRFRSSGAQSISSLSNTTAVPGQSLLRQRAAPPRRNGSPTRQLTRQRTQGDVQDLRLAPVIQQPVSGVPLPGLASVSGIVPLPRPLNGFGLAFPTASFLDNAFTRRPPEPDPAYAPLGIKLGNITVLPAFTQYVGYDANPAQTVDRLARSSAALYSEGEVAFRSDWATSELTGELRGGYSEFPSNEAASRPNASGITRLRIDANRDTRIDLETRFLVDTQRFGSPDLGTITATQRPLFATFGATAGVTETFNRIQISLRGSVDRQVFEDARLSDGSRLVQSDRDANQYALRLRAGYEISPVLTPFVETIVDTRVYDTPVDQAGIRRDSDGIGFNVGATFELTRTLAGEVSAGLQHRDYVDPTLRSVLAPIVNAALIWSFSPLTTVRFNHQAGVIETAVPGSSAVFTDATAVEVQHNLLRNFALTGGLSFINADYQGVAIRERGFAATLRGDYRVNRWLTLRGSYVYQQIASTAPNASFNDNIFLLGVRINP